MPEGDRRDSAPPRLRARWLREPAVHFVAIGGLLFALHAGVRPPGAADGDAAAARREIVISADFVAGLAEDWQRRMGRSATDQEIEQAVQRFVDDEVLQREALALGLDRGDPIVRRRLAQKMQFLIEDQPPLGEPSTAELRDYLAQRSDRYALPPRVRLTQVFLARQLRRGTLEQDAQRLLARLRREGIAPDRAQQFADASLLPAQTPLRSEQELAKTFGPAFGSSVITLQSRQWHGPIESTYGLHLVWIAERTAARTATLDEVRPQVRLALIAERREQRRSRQLERLRRRYRVRIDWPAGRPAGRRGRR